jgi:hypothetical protein
MIVPTFEKDLSVLFSRDELMTSEVVRGMYGTVVVKGFSCGRTRNSSHRFGKPKSPAVGIPS